MATPRPRSSVFRRDRIPCATGCQKFLKGFLVWHQLEFPKTHDIDELLRLIAVKDKSLLETLHGVSVLTNYGVDTRYPADLPELTLNEAFQAVELAKQTRDAVLNSLPNFSAQSET